MQGFAGLSLFSVLLLMGLGLAILFGQMGVINMAHGEFMTIGAYTIFLASSLTESFAPALMPYYFIVAIGFAFVFAFVVGWLTEWALIRHLYRRPLDTLLATWGVSLGLQQVFRSTFGATVANRTMANAIGINTRRTDRMTFAIGCGIAGIAGAAFTTIGSTGPTAGSLYIVDAFLVVTFGGAASLLGTVASAFGIAQTQAISEFFMTGSMARVLTLMSIITILMIRPQGLFALKVRR
jgi:urea transport system permease protein